MSYRDKEPPADLFVATQLRGVQQGAVIEKLGYELSSTHSGVTVWEGEQGGHRGDQQHLDDRVVPEPSGFPCRTRKDEPISTHKQNTKRGKKRIKQAVLTRPAPRDVGLDEQRPPEAAEYPQQDERCQLHQVPRGVELHIKQHQAAVSKRVDGAQGEGRHQGGEERTPQGFQGEVITHLGGNQEKQEVSKRLGFLPIYA